MERQSSVLALREAVMNTIKRGPPPHAARWTMDLHSPFQLRTISRLTAESCRLRVTGQARGTTQAPVGT